MWSIRRFLKIPRARQVYDEWESDMNSLQQYEQVKRPHYGEEIDEYYFAAGKLDKVMRDLNSGAISFEVVTNCKNEENHFRSSMAL